MGWTAVLVGVLILTVLTVAAVFVLGMRAKWPPVLSVVRRLNRRFTNPRQMRSAGKPGAYASIIRHVGRRSGTRYETPVVPVPTDDGFLIPLPYGLHPDWLKNVLAAGSATIVREGHTYLVDHPETIPMETVITRFPASERGNLRRFRVSRCLQVRQVEEDGATPSEQLPT